MLELEYTRKPSIATIKAAAKKAIANGETFIVFQWGENQITLERGSYGMGYHKPKWYGSGWIGRNGGQDIADDLNKGA